MSEYRVALRHTTLLESAALEDLGDDRHFIATAAPPPTSSILTLEAGDERKYFLVDKVYEVESDGQTRGVAGKLSDAEAHEQASMLGTEHLEDGEAPDEGAPPMAMPAPVVDPDGSDDDADENERQRLEGDGDSSADDAADDEGETSSADGDAGDAGSNDEQNSGGRRGKKRRGRRRR